MQDLSRKLVRVGILISLMVVLTLSAQGAKFTNASVQGSYSFLTNRWTADPSDTLVAMVGILTFDGVGNATLSFTDIVGGQIKTGTFSGTYIVNSDGSGTITWSNSPNQVMFNLNSTVAKVAHGFQYFVNFPNDPYNEASTGFALIQSTTAATYGLGSLKGNFSYGFGETSLDPAVPIQGGIGLFTFDGMGNVKGSSRYETVGVLQTGTFTGTYMVNPDGSGTISLSNNAQYAFVLNSVAGGLAKGVMFIQTNTTGNAAVSGTAQKQ